ncbi:hypothetical protein GCM10010203_55910 [Actinomadura yumaensis]
MTDPTAEEFIDPAIDQLARLAAIEHAMAVQWYTFACNQADRLDLPVAEVAAAFKEGVCGSLLDGYADVPPPIRDLVRAHATRSMNHVMKMARLNDQQTGRGKPA